MGGALLAAWLRAGIKPQSITVIVRNAVQAKELAQQGIKTATSLDEVADIPDCVILAVKPQSMDQILPPCAKKFGNKSLYLSIAVGKTLAYFATYLASAPIVRAMPNTPSLIRKGMSALCANEQVSQEQKQLATSLLAAAGEVVWLQDESQIDIVAAISGSGPAYVFLFMEALIAAGKAQGLPEDMCVKLALHTVRGSAKLAMKSDVPLEQLRKNVTSPGGTTQAALGVLMQEKGLISLIDEAVKAAIKRAKELA
jgi:pyrroline-5-carboxylate reductase